MSVIEEAIRLQIRTGASHLQQIEMAPEAYGIPLSSRSTVRQLRVDRNKALHVVDVKGFKEAGGPGQVEKLPLDVSDCICPKGENHEHAVVHPKPPGNPVVSDCICPKGEYHHEHRTGKSAVNDCICPKGDYHEDEVAHPNDPGKLVFSDCICPKGAYHHQHTPGKSAVSDGICPEGDYHEHAAEEKPPPDADKLLRLLCEFRRGPGDHDTIQMSRRYEDAIRKEYVDLQM